MTEPVTKQMVNQENKQEFNPMDIPEQVANWFGADSARWAKRVSVEFDVQRIVKTSRKGIVDDDARRIAFVLWRARTIQRYVKLEGGAVMPWAEAVEHANLRDAIWDIADARRREAQEQRKASNLRLSSATWYTAGGADNTEELAS